MKTPPIPEEFNMIVDSYVSGIEGLYSSEEEYFDSRLALMTKAQIRVVKDYLDELLGGKYAEDDLRVMWRASEARLLPFWGDEGSCAECLETMRSRVAASLE
jgi:hypothetical protein